MPIPKSVSPPNSSKSGYQSGSAQKTANTKSSALNVAKSWLADWLAEGPRPSLETIERAAAAGIAEKTLRRAAKALSVETAQSGARWFWMLPAKVAGPDGQVEQMAKPDGQALSTTTPVAPPVRVVPAPKPPRILPDFRRRATRPGRWGVPGLVRCIECVFLDDIDAAGRCEAGDRSIVWPFARRSCPAFESYEQ